METTDRVGLLVPITYLTMLAVDSLWPARQFPPRAGWRCIAFLLLIASVGAVVPLLLPLDRMAAHRWIDGTGLGVAGGTLVGWFVFCGVAHAYHRTPHTWAPLWRLTHQIHHSPRRVAIPGSVQFHPVEMVVQVLLQLFVTVVVLGLDSLAAALVGYVSAFYGMLQHWNVPAPQWLGYLLQRPEAHCVHHRRGVHAFNCGDLPLRDMRLGKLRNPREYVGDCGFDTPADRRRGAKLGFVDVNRPLYGRGSLGAATAAFR
jgi:sterol desaturase/sphingolipid hydroxylase (fatty acid hydroxylase superfamily)